MGIVPVKQTHFVPVVPVTAQDTVLQNIIEEEKHLKGKKPPPVPADSTNDNNENSNLPTPFDLAGGK